MPKIVIGNAMSTIEGASVSELTELKAALSYPVPNRLWGLQKHIEIEHGIKVRRKTFEQAHDYAAQAFPKCWKCNWNWEISMVKGNSFPTGLLPVVKRALAADVEDSRTVPIAFPVPHNVDARYYQRDIIDIAKSKGNGIIELATGGGKTESAIALACELGLKTLIATPTKAVFNEFRNRWPKYVTSEAMGIIGEGKRLPQRVTVAIMDHHWTESDFGKQIAAETECLIVDEHHKSAARTWFDYFITVNAYYRFGQSATPSREHLLDYMKLQAVVGQKIVKVDTQTLQAQGYLVPAIIRMIPVNIYLHTRDWMERYREGIAQNAERNGIIISEAIAAASRGEKVLVVVNWEEQHGRILAEALGDVVYFRGGMSSKQLATQKAIFMGEKNIAVGTPAVGLGFDVPMIDVLINAAGGKSPTLTQQRLGRALRNSPGKDHATVIDFDDRDGGILQKHSGERIETYRRLGQEVVEE